MKIRTDPRTGMKYADYMCGGKRVRVSLKTKNEKVAIIKAAKLADDKDTMRTGRITLEAFLAKYRAFLQATRKPDTAKHFELGLKKFLSIKSVKYLDEITPAALDEVAITLKAKIRSANAPGLNRAIRAIKTAMRQAEFWELVPPQSWRKVSKFKESKGRVEYHTPAEIKKILSVFSSNWQLVVLLGCRAGLRRGEIAALKWKDVDFKRKQIYIEPNKTEKGRDIPIADDLLNALTKAHKSAKSEFVADVGRNRESKYFLTAYYEKETSALPFRCHLHKLRHTFASHLVQSGVDLYRVSKLLGHSSIQMTEIYAHLAPQDLTSAIKKLPAIK